MSVLPGSRSSVLLGVLVVALLAGPAGGFSHSSGATAPLAPSGNSICPGAVLPSTYQGSMGVEGGPLTVANLSDANLSFGFSAEVTERNLVTGALVDEECDAIHDASLTGSNGSFSLLATLPATSCNRALEECTSYDGPFGPLSVGASAGAPSGYLPSVTWNSTSVRVVYVAELTALRLDPNGSPATYTSDAADPVEAVPLTANGSVTPVTPQYRWTLSGSGWMFDGPGSGPSVSVTATPGAGAAVLTVTATITAGPTTLTAGPDSLTLQAVTTAIATAVANRTEVDPGRPVLLSVTAFGAAGYRYNATVLPGLGLPSSPLACTSQAPDGGTVTLLCSSVVSYPTTGVASPLVEVTNGYSAASAVLEPVAVVPFPAVSITPAALAGYAGSQLTVQVEARPGTGSGPYTGACFGPGVGSPTCSSSAGPNWTFHPDYAGPGSFAASGWVVDGDGVVASVAVPVAIVEPLDLGPVSAGPASVPVGALVPLSANLTGGLIPGTYWWNVSGSNRTIESGPVERDGILTASWVPSTVGPEEITLAVTDALGSSQTRSVTLTVVPDTVTALPLVTPPPADPVAAGTPVALAWQAYYPHGVAALTFAPTVAIRLSSTPGASGENAWFNVSGVGPLRLNASGVVEVPSAAWSLGRLNATVATVSAGVLEVTLSGVAIPGAPSIVTMVVAPDLRHLKLYDPDVARAGDRTNRTFWHVSDEYGNPAVGASVEVQLESGGTSVASTSPVVGGPGGPVGVWVNYTLTTPAGGTLEVLSDGGVVLLGPIALPAAGSASTGSGSLVVVAVLAPFGVAGLGAAVWMRRRRPSPSGGAGAIEPPEVALREFVNGRDRVIETVRDAGAADLSQIERAWGDPSPPAELPDWVASLVADGTLGARTGPDGVSRFCLAGPAEGPAHVILDERALERATSARDDLLREDDDPPDDA